MHYEPRIEPTDFRADMECKGNIFDIQRNTIHDGPGTRTSVFLKGCSLACSWCCSSESQGAFAKEMSVAQVMEEILKDKDTFQETGGGVTICGGEAFEQPQFTLELLKACKKQKIQTCVQSSLCVDWDVVEEALPFIDCVITDIRQMDPEQHLARTGGNLELVQQNIRKLARAYRDTIIRIPLIPGYNDSPDNISKTSVFIDEEFGINLLQVQVLQFPDQSEVSKAAYAESIKQAMAVIKEQGLPSFTDSQIGRCC